MMTASEFARFDGIRKLLIRDLGDVVASRDTSRADWWNTELRRFHTVACERAVLADLRQPTWDDIKRSDQRAAGHVDWSTKLPLYVTEVMFNLVAGDE